MRWIVLSLFRWSRGQAYGKGVCHPAYDRPYELQFAKRASMVFWVAVMVVGLTSFVTCGEAGTEGPSTRATSRATTTSRQQFKRLLRDAPASTVATEGRAQ